MEIRTLHPGDRVAIAAAVHTLTAAASQSCSAPTKA